MKLTRRKFLERPTSIILLVYSYGTTNNNGNVLTATYNGGGLSYTQTFGYDALNRLTTAQENSGANWSQTNSYDRYGNRSIVGGGLSPLSKSLETPRKDRNLNAITIRSLKMRGKHSLALLLLVAALVAVIITIGRQNSEIRIISIY